MILSMKELLFSRTKTTRFFIGFPVRPSQGVRGIFVFRTKSRPGNRTEPMRQSRKRETNGAAGNKKRSENRHRQKHETGASALQNPKGAILKAMRKTGAFNFQKQLGITPYDRARRKTAKKPRPKQNETDRSGQKTAKGPKTKPQFHR